MQSKTPQFDYALDALYQGMTPHVRTCVETRTSFFVSQRDIDAYRALRIPLPTVAPMVRLRRMRAAVAGFDLFRRTLLDGPSVVSMYDPESSVPILPANEWHSDRFDPMKFGCAYDLSVSFFDQWQIFSNAVPRPAIIQDLKTENSPWALYTASSKNVYFTYAGMDEENVSYADFSIASRDSVDISYVYRSAHCYHSVLLNACLRTHFSEQCNRCIDVIFSLACSDCSDCFGCTNLRRKKFCFLNEQLTEEEYRERCKAIDLSDASVVEAWEKKIQEIWNKAYRKAGTIYQSERAIGDELWSCKDVEGISMTNAERVYYAFTLMDVKDSVDVALALQLERCANLVGSQKGYENKMVNTCEGCIDIEYSELLASCEHCFGCIGLKYKKYCVLNQQYTEEEYWKLVDQLKTDMLAHGEYGEFFPYRVSPWAYNTSHADAQFPMEEKEARALGARWYAFAQEREVQAQSVDTLPLRLKDTTEEALKEVYRCPVSGRAFRIVKPELDLHREFGIALPRVHPTVRRKERIKQCFPIVLQERACSACSTIVATRIPATYPSPLLCESCYEERVLG